MADPARSVLVGGDVAAGLPTMGAGGVPASRRSSLAEGVAVTIAAPAPPLRATCTAPPKLRQWDWILVLSAVSLCDAGQRP